MINGEEARDGASRIDYPDRQDDMRDSKSDGGKESPSWYSSCAESEFERYSSANSVMGTPNLCSFSSVANYSDSLGNSEFGSFKSMGFVDDGGSEGFSLGGREGNGMSVGDGSLSMIDPRPRGNCGGDSKEMKWSDRGEVAWRVIKFNGENSFEEQGREALSPKGRSEDEDSMYGDKLADECKRDFAYSSNTRQNQGRLDVDFNPLLMNSSVAFGSNDWDDFTLETAENSGDGLMFKEFQRKREVSYNIVEDAPEDLCMPREEPQYEEKSNSSDVNSTDAKVEKSRTTDSPFLVKGNNQELDVKVEKGNEDASLSSCDRQAIMDESEEYLKSCSITNVFESGQDSMMVASQLELEIQLDSAKSIGDEKHPFGSRKQLISTVDGLVLEGKYLEDIVDPLSLQDDVKSDHYPIATEIVNSELCDAALMSSTTVAMGAHHPRKSKDLAFSDHPFEDQTLQEETKALELNGYIDDVINEMEEILLDVGESPRLQKDQKLSQSQLCSASRDAGSTASTSGNEDVVDARNEKMIRIDGVEVIGARQKKGEVSLSERLVGVKEYTVYRIKVWGGDNNWEVERRYRDFLTLYRQMKALFSDEGWVLPPPWSMVDKESRKIFGSASPDVVAERSEMIQECLRSIIQSSFCTDLPPCFIWFLSPEDSHMNISESSGLIRQSTFNSTGTDVEILSPLGKTIPLIVEVRPQKSLKQLLDAQHYRCAGCHRHFDDSKTLMRDFMQTLGWGKPRVCEYTGQLFCSVCHTNETTVLPARVLHYWDFTEYPVCQLSKSYLDSIHDQPMLCIGAVNPFLFSKVPALLHVMNLRKKIGSMLPCIRCPFRLSINRGLGSRKYLLESDDFFALRDLIDLSKGPFAALPVMLETVSKKIREHIMERCLICCDLGVPCGAKQACADPSSLIFPFQESELEKCRYCQAVYHQKCFKDLGKCPCRSEAGPTEALRANDATGDRDLILRSSDAILFPKSTSGKVKFHKEGNNVLLMGSLPSTSL